MTNRLPPVLLNRFEALSLLYDACLKDVAGRQYRYGFDDESFFAPVENNCELTLTAFRACLNTAAFILTVFQVFSFPFGPSVPHAAPCARLWPRSGLCLSLPSPRLWSAGRPKRTQGFGTIQLLAGLTGGASSRTGLCSACARAQKRVAGMAASLCSAAPQQTARSVRLSAKATRGGKKKTH